MDTLKDALTTEEQRTMEISHPAVGDDWEQVLSMIPVDLETSAKEYKALQRKREVKSAAELLRMVLMYSLCDWPFRMVAVWATIIGLGSLSDVAVRKRLRQAQAWLGFLVGAWLQQRRVQLIEKQAVRVRLVDATSINHPGSNGVDWRVHLSFDLGRGCIDGVEVTDVSGGETLVRQVVEAGDIEVGDRGYAHRRGLGTVLAAVGQFVVRINWQNLPLEHADGQKFDIIAWLQAEVGVLTADQAVVWVTTPAGRYEVRLVARRLPPEIREQARRRAHQRARKKGRTADARTLIAAEYLTVLTNLPLHAWPPQQVLALYRLRWQVELAFKRFKSIMHLDHLRAKDPQVAQVYLLGKLLAVLLLDAWTGNLTANLADWFSDTLRPLSFWRWTKLWVVALLQAVRGPLSFSLCLAALPKLARFLRDAPRKRRQQFACARAWLDTLNLGADTLSLACHVPSFA